MPNKMSDVRISFLNTLAGNEENGARIVDTALSFDPDIIGFAESRSVLMSQEGGVALTLMRVLMQIGPGHAARSK